MAMGCSEHKPKRWFSRVLCLAVVGSATACGDDPVEPQDEPVPALEAVGPSFLSGTVADTLPSALAVRAYDARDGSPLVSRTVFFTVTDGVGTLIYERPGRRSFASGPGATLEGLTDLDGVVAVDYVVPTAAGFGGIRAVTPNAADTVRFGIQSRAGPVAAVLRSGEGQVATPGATLPLPLSVVVQDAFGNPIPDVVVTWHVRSGGGTLERADTTTDDFGRAYAEWTLGSDLGAQELDADVTGAGTFAFTATAR